MLTVMVMSAVKFAALCIFIWVLTRESKAILVAFILFFSTVYQNIPFLLSDLTLTVMVTSAVKFAAQILAPNVIMAHLSREIGNIV